MSRSIGVMGWMSLVLLSMSACAAELSLPDLGRSEGTGGGRTDVPNDGITGVYSEGGSPPEPPSSPLKTERPKGAASAGEGGAAVTASVTGKAGSTATPAGSAESPPPASSGSGGAAGTAPIEPELPPDGSGGTAGTPPVEPPPPPPLVLLFSEYLEGSGSTKALEIFVVSGDSLEGCDLLTYFNGASEPSRLALHGPVKANDVYVLCSSQLAQADPDRCDRSTNLTFNGNDAIALACAGTVLDVFGQIGFDPGAAWGDGLSVDHTLRRSCSVTQGRVDGSEPFDPSLEWLALPVDPADLGSRSCP